MSWIDFVVVAVLLYTTVKGASKGLISQLTWIVALVACFAFAESISLNLAPTIAQAFPQVEPPLDRWIAMFILYMGFAFVSFGVARVLKGWLEKAKFADFDKHLGGIFGLVKGVVICMIAIFFGVTLSDSLRQNVLASHSGHAAAVIMQRLGPVMPKELAGVIEKAQQQLPHDEFHTDDLDGHDHGGVGEFIDGFPQLGGNNPPANGGQSSGGFLDGLFGTGSTGQGTDTDSAQTPGTNRSGSNTQTDSLTSFIQQLPTSIGNDIKNSALDALRNSTPEQKRQLYNQLQSSVTSQTGDKTGVVSNVLKNWAGETLGLRPRDGNGSGFDSNTNGSSSPFDESPVDRQPAPIATNNGQPAATIVTRVLGSIGKIYSDRPDAQQDFINSITRQLQGVPGQVQAVVLQDWYADLMPGQTDPDPQTGFTTKLDTRILRQLQAAGISPTRLSSQLQKRLSDSARQ